MMNFARDRRRAETSAVRFVGPAGDDDDLRIKLLDERAEQRGVVLLVRLEQPHVQAGNQFLAERDVHPRPFGTKGENRARRMRPCLRRRARQQADIYPEMCVQQIATFTGATPPGRLRGKRPERSVWSIARRSIPSRTYGGHIRARRRRKRRSSASASQREIAAATGSICADTTSPPPDSVISSWMLT